MENKNERTYGLGYLIFSILLFIGTIIFIWVAYNYTFGKLADFAKQKEEYVANLIIKEQKKAEKEEKTSTTTINNYYTTNIDNSVNVDVNGDENNVNVGCGNTTNFNGVNPTTPTTSYPTCNKESKKICYTDNYENSNYSYEKYRWNKIINIKNYEYWNFKPTFTNKCIEIKGYITSIPDDTIEGRTYFILREEKNGRDHMIYCLDNSVIRNWIVENSIHDIAKNESKPIIIRGQIVGDFAKGDFDWHLFNIDVWCVEIGG